MLSQRLLVTCVLGVLLLGAYHHNTIRERFNSLLATPSAALEDRISTLGVFSDIYVVGLPARHDRRASMDRLRHALGLRWEYVDAIPATDAVVARIEACVRALRDQSEPGEIEWPSEGDLAALDFGPAYTPRNSAARSLDDFALSFCPPLDASYSPSVDLLTCADADSTHGMEYAPPATPHWHHLLTSPKIACWYSHLSAILRFARSGHGQAALILEDDVDMERDIKPRLEGLWQRLPDDWDMVYLGYCWSNETFYPAVPPHKTAPLPLQNALHHAHTPLCTHAYVLSRTGAHRLLAHLTLPHFAFSRALDQALAWLVRSGRIRAFSVVPPLVVQAKVTASDIDGGADGRGSPWRERLADGVLAGFGEV